jgi:hypothetical protein
MNNGIVLLLWFWKSNYSGPYEAVNFVYEK